MSKRSNIIPYGKDILNPKWPDATWDVGVLFVHDHIMFEWLETVQQKFNCEVPIKSVFGCYSVMWSGGRNCSSAYSWDYSGWTPEVFIKEYNNRGINVTYTFSNTLLKEEHLTDPSSNYLLDLLGKQEYDGNAVTISCDVLSDYIREKYPNLKQKASIVKVTTERPIKRTFEYYNSLFEKYDLVYIHPDDNLDLKLLEKIAQSGKQDKYTLLINEPCTRNCSIRNSHYDEISRAVIDGWHGQFNFTNVQQFHSPHHPNSICEKIHRPEIRLCILSEDEFKNVYDLGFRTFKLQGRDVPWNTMLHNFSVWMFEQDSISEKIFAEN